VLRYLIIAFFVSASCIAEKPNILFISVDDLNDWVGFLKGHPQAYTPNMDRLARRGVAFTNAHCAAPLCNPSRNAVMTGQYPHTTGLFTNGESIFQRNDLTTLPQYFQENGYTTLGAGKLFHGKNQHDEQDFTRYGPTHDAKGPKGGPFSKEELNTDLQTPYNDVPRFKTKLPLNGMPSDRIRQKANSFDWGPVDAPDEAFADGVVAKWGIDQLAEKHDKPFFLGLGFYRPHIPLYAPKEYFERLEGEKIILPEVIDSDVEDLPLSGKNFAVMPISAGTHYSVAAHKNQWEDAVRAYLASVSFVDAQIGKVLDALDASPYADNTIIVLWSDHGWHLGEKQHWGKFTGWQRSTHVPLVIAPAKATGIRTGTRSSRPVSLVDIFPTLVQLADLPELEQLEGDSLARLLENPRNPFRAYAWTIFGRGNYAITTEEWKFIRYFDGTKELYHSAKDPHEWHNLASDPDYARQVHEFEARMPRPKFNMVTARHENWKAVFPKGGGEPLLFDHGRPGGPNDMENVAKDNKRIVSRIALNLEQYGDRTDHQTLNEGSPTYERKWLFQGNESDLDNWFIRGQTGRKKNAVPKPITGAWTIKDRAITHTPSGGYLWTLQEYKNFILELEVNVTPGANSGVYLWAQKDDPTQRGLEVQVLDSAGQGQPDKHAMGALYEYKEPIVNAALPAGEWQTLRIHAEDPWVAVTLNGTLIIRENIDKWKTVGQNPDGTKNKYKYALAESPRKGHISLQDHNNVVSFRNIRVMRLP
jgi:arylsulfatase A-like enzyme